jgi:hypothetical protein
MHSDVFALDPRIWSLCRGKLEEGFGLVSPEDIGCGPMTRPFGAGKPESSFIFVDTVAIRRLRKFQGWHRGQWPWLRREVDFYGEHVTHRLPAALEEHGIRWFRMRALVSERTAAPIYTPPFNPKVWSPELPFLRYGLGNFYSMDGVITHYHNWYERILRFDGGDLNETTEPNGRGFPIGYIRAYTSAFLRDLDANELKLPAVDQPERKPEAL